MPDREHPLDSLADELYEWMEGEVSYFTDTLRGPSQRAPFSAETSEQQKNDYYARQMFKTSPDGRVQYDQPNHEGRDRLLKTYGTRTYADIWEAVRPRGAQTPPAPPDPMDALTGAVPPMPEDDEPVEPD